MAKNGKKSDIEHKGGWGSGLNHSFKLIRKNDKSIRRERAQSHCHPFNLSENVFF